MSHIVWPQSAAKKADVIVRLAIAAATVALVISIRLRTINPFQISSTFIIFTVLYAWVLLRAILSKQITNAVVASSALIVLMSSLLPNNVYPQTTEYAIIISFFLFFPLFFDITLPGFVAVCATLACALAFMLLKGRGSNSEVQTWVKVALVISWAPVLIWYVAYRNEIWDESYKNREKT